MKKIILSLAIIGAASAIAVGGTIAYFSDTETSTGNTFTAGSLDLIVDIDGVDQNPLVDKIFDLPDMKPGDTGEKTISLKVDNNPACGFVNIDLKSDLDNSCTEPEGQAVIDPLCADNDGELNDSINFAIWADTDCDNIYDEGEVMLTGGTITEDINYQIGELPVAPQKQCYGVAYCFGAWGTGMTCDGASVNNESQSDSFAGDIIFTAQQKRNQYPNGCPIDGGIVQMGYVNLENKNENWQIIPNDGIQGVMQYSVNDTTFHGAVSGTGLVPNGKYQITLNGPTEASGLCSFTNVSLGNFGANTFQSGFWNSAWPNLSSTCTAGDEEGLYNMNLIGDHYTFIADGTGAFNYSFGFNLPNGSYSGVKVLVKKMLDTHVSPWVDSTTVHTSNLFEVAPISFTVI